MERGRKRRRRERDVLLDRNFEIDASLDDIHHTYRSMRARKTDRTFKIVSCESKIQTALISAAASPNEKRRRAATRRDAALDGFTADHTSRPRE